MFSSKEHRKDKSCNQHLNTLPIERDTQLVKWLIRLLFPFVFFFAFVSLSGFGQEGFRKDFPVLSSVYNVDKEPIDYLIVIDQSASVRPFWDEIKSSIQRVINLTKVGDYLSIIGFHSTSDFLVIPRSINSSVKQELIQEIRNLQLPFGQKTDLFESVDKTLEAINRPQGNHLQVVFYFTDFVNDPPQGTRWTVTSEDRLRIKYANYITNTNKFVNVFAFQLPIDVRAGRDFAIFDDIFNHTVKRILVNTGTLQEWFIRLSDELQRERLKLMLVNDLKDVFLKPSVFPSDKSVRLGLSHKLNFPLKLNEVEVMSTNPNLKISINHTNHTLVSKKVQEVDVPADQYLSSIPGFFEKTIRITNPIIRIQYSFEALGKEFAKLNVPTEHTQVINLNQSISLKKGFPYWAGGLVLLLLMLVLWFIYQTWFKPEWVFKKKKFKVYYSLNGRRLTLNKELFGPVRKEILLDNQLINTDHLDSEIKKITSEFIFKIHLVSATPRFLSPRPRRGTYLWKESSESFSVSKLSKGKLISIPLPKEKRNISEPVSLRKGIKIRCEFFRGINKYDLEINFSHT